MLTGTADSASICRTHEPLTSHRFLLVSEVAELINPKSDVVSANTIYRLIQADRIPAIKIGDRRKYAVPARAVDLLAACGLGRILPSTGGLARERCKPADEAPPVRRAMVLSVPQAARLLRVCRATIERAYLANQFPVVRFSGRVTVPMKAIDEMEAAALSSGGLVYASDWCAGT